MRYYDISNKVLIMVYNFCDDSCQNNIMVIEHHKNVLYYRVNPKLNTPITDSSSKIQTISMQTMDEQHIPDWLYHRILLKVSLGHIRFLL